MTPVKFLKGHPALCVHEHNKYYKRLLHTVLLREAFLAALFCGREGYLGILRGARGWDTERIIDVYTQKYKAIDHYLH